MRVIRAAQGSFALQEGIVSNYVVSGQTAGTSGIFMACYRLPPATSSVRHYHANCETATYILKGHAQVHGDQDPTALTLGPGDMLYVPANEVHVISNPSASDWLEYLSARSAPEEMLVEVAPEPGKG